MAEQFSSIERIHLDFILRQRVFFVASAAEGTRVNVSPKPVAALRVLGANSAVYLDQTGSGNETSAHLRVDGRLTFMFCAFEGPPRILRLYGRGSVLRRDEVPYRELLEAEFAGEELAGARQILSLDVELVQTSCGYGVPLFTFVGERDTLKRWADAKGEAGLDAYRRKKNVRSIDGLLTGLFDVDDGALQHDPTKTRSERVPRDTRG